MSFMGGLDTPTLFSCLNARIVVFDVARGVSGSRRPDIVRGDHTHWACL